MRFAIVLAALLSCSLAQAQSPAELKKCRSIKDGLERLSCFDRVVPSDVTSIGNSVSPKLKVVDLMTDYKELAGKEVTVTGFAIAAGGETLYLYTARGEVSAVVVNTKNVDRDGRKNAISLCGSGCDIEVTGKPASQYGQVTMVATSLTIK